MSRLSQSHHQLKDRIRDVFDRASPTYDHIGPRFFSHFGRNVVALAKLEPGSRVLDVATGSGAVLSPAATAVGPSGTIVGIDLSPEMVKRTRREAWERSMKQ